MTGNFAGRACIVTGASSGIGREIAVELGRAGADVWLVGLNEGRLREAASAVDAAGGRGHCALLDLRQRGKLAALIEEVSQAHPHLFALVNNAGVMHPEPIMSGTMERWQAMFDINVLAVLEGCKAAVEAMRRHGKPAHIVNISSLAARFESGVYGASKLALMVIARSLRDEIEQDQIRIATILPGGFATRLGRGVLPEQAAHIAQYFKDNGIDPGGPGSEKLIGDPAHISRMVRYVLEQPIEINIEEITMRPPISMEF